KAKLLHLPTSLVPRRVWGIFRLKRISSQHFINAHRKRRALHAQWWRPLGLPPQNHRSFPSTTRIVPVRSRRQAGREVLAIHGKTAVPLPEQVSPEELPLTLEHRPGLASNL